MFSDMMTATMRMLGVEPATVLEQAAELGRTFARLEAGQREMIGLIHALTAHFGLEIPPLDADMADLAAQQTASHLARLNAPQLEHTP